MPPLQCLLARRVLVIDDNVDAAELLVSLLTALDHTAVCAHDGPSGIILAVSFIPDVVFLDIGMPGMNGFDVAIALRKMKHLENTRIVALTGWKDEATKQRARDSGFDMHLCKPANLGEISDALAHGRNPTEAGLSSP